MSISRGVHLYGLDLLRFLAAMLVLLGHFGTYAFDHAGVTDLPDQRAYGFLNPFVGVGATGVQIFFVISGFVIAMSSVQMSGGVGALRFALARLTRLLPALWISSAISVFALLLCDFDLGPLLARASRSVVLSPLGPYIDGVVWSLVVEAVFYLVIGLAIFFCVRLPLVKIAITLGLVSSTFLAILLTVKLAGAETSAALLDRFPFKVFLLHHGVFFAIGMLIWHAMSQPYSWALRAAQVLFVTMAMVEIWLLYEASTLRGVASVLIWGVAMGWLLLSIRRPLFKSHPETLRFLGDLSYPIYLNHYTTGMATVFLLQRAGFSGVRSFVIAFCVVMLTSCVVLIAERKIRSRLRPTVAAIAARQNGHQASRLIEPR